MPEADNVGGFPFTYSPEERDEPANTIVQAVAWIRDVRGSDLDALQHTVDVDTLNRLFGNRPGAYDRRSSGEEASRLELSFHYEGCEVTVRQSRVQVDPE